jgi:nitroreductase
VLAHVAGIPVEEALLAAPALLAGVTVIAGYVRDRRAPAPLDPPLGRDLRHLGHRVAVGDREAGDRVRRRKHEDTEA